MPKKIYKTKLKSADKKQVSSSLSELTDAAILLLDRQDKYDSEMTKLQKKNNRLQATLDNLINDANTFVNQKEKMYHTIDQQQIQIEKLKEGFDNLASNSFNMARNQDNKLDQIPLIKNNFKELYDKTDIQINSLINNFESLNESLFYNKKATIDFIDEHMKLFNRIQQHNKLSFFRRLFHKI